MVSLFFTDYSADIDQFMCALFCNEIASFRCVFILCYIVATVEQTTCINIMLSIFVDIYVTFQSACRYVG